MTRKYTTEILPRDAWPERDSIVERTPQGTLFPRSEWLVAPTNNVDALFFQVRRNGSGSWLPAYRSCGDPFELIEAFKENIDE